MPDFACARCGECCKRYFIVSLPHEVSAQAKLLGIPEKDFAEKKMWLYLQLFPTEPSEGKITVNAKDMPKKILEKIEQRLGFAPANFVALPLLCFRRAEGGECNFYDSAKKGCTIYPARPRECTLFPFISLKESPDYAALYPFCKGLAAGYNKDIRHSAKANEHFAEVAVHLGGVKEKGFRKIWGHWPKHGVCLLEGDFLCKISEKDFFETIVAYK